MIPAIAGAEHVADPRLSATSIAAAHFISTRHLHRLFAHRGGTVGRQIQRLRLERCRGELLDPDAGARSTASISRRWGFPDGATFSRAFRSVYGMSPSQCRAGRSTEHSAALAWGVVPGGPADAPG